jgi:hypothetical protein
VVTDRPRGVAAAPLVAASGGVPAAALFLLFFAPYDATVAIVLADVTKNEDREADSRLLPAKRQICFFFFFFFFFAGRDKVSDEAAPANPRPSPHTQSGGKRAAVVSSASGSQFKR